MNLEQATLNQITLVDPITQTPYAGYDSLSVNDSRLYVMQGGRWTQVTRDHSLVAQMAARGPADRRAGPSTRVATW